MEYIHKWVPSSGRLSSACRFASSLSSVFNRASSRMAMATRLSSTVSEHHSRGASKYKVSMDDQISGERVEKGDV
jgi:hypothetical protein